MSRLTQLVFLRPVLAGLCLWAQGLTAAEPALSFEDAWIRALPPGMGMTAGFGMIRNDGPDALVLTGFSSPEFEDVSLHRTEQVDGVSRMRAVPALELTAGAGVELAPGGYHLMLMKPVHALREGQTVTLRMRSDDGSVFEFEVPVTRR